MKQVNKKKQDIKKHFKKMKNYISKFINGNWPILIIMIISLILHILAIKQLGFNYTLNSDDASYVKSGITFLQTGKITMHGVISAQIMPGMTFLIAFMALIFGTGFKLMIALKILWMLMGILTIYIVYKTINLYYSKYISTLPCIFFLAIDYIWMDNLTLTETPYILLFALLIYHTLKLSKNTNNKDYILIVIYYIMAVFIRPNIGIFPLCLFVFLLLKKYNFKLLIKQCSIAGIILLVCLTPWTYRNYKVFGKFIPLTYGTGNPLLLGTYQGFGYPSDEELDYKKNVDEKMTKEMKTLIIIPAYNEELNIEKTVNKIKKYNNCSKNTIDYIIINDGSTDNTKEICDKNKFNVINLIHNLGIGGAVQAGYKYALENNYDIAIQFDGDGQHDEKYIDSLIKEIENGADFVIGSRFIENLSQFKSSSTRRIGIKILSILIKICTGKKIYDPTSGFRASNKKVIKIFSDNYPSEYPEPESTTLLINRGYNVKEIPVEMHEREFGESSIKPLKSIYYMFSVCLSIVVTSINKGGLK